MSSTQGSISTLSRTAVSASMKAGLLGRMADLTASVTNDVILASEHETRRKYASRAVISPNVYENLQAETKDMSANEEADYFERKRQGGYIRAQRTSV